MVHELCEHSFTMIKCYKHLKHMINSSYETKHEARITPYCNFANHVDCNACDANAECRLISAGGVECTCDQGYTGDGFSCSCKFVTVFTFMNGAHYIRSNYAYET